MLLLPRITVVIFILFSGIVGAVFHFLQIFNWRSLSFGNFSDERVKSDD